MYTNSEFIAFQRQDSELSQIFKFLEKNEEHHDLNGIARDYRRFIYRISTRDNFLVFNDRGNIIVIVTQNLREEVLHYSHCDWSSGHLGIFKTHCGVLERFWWPKLHGHIEAFTATWELCQKAKTSGKLHGQMGIQSCPSLPLELVSINFIVDLPTTPRGHEHILVMNNQFSKFLKCYPFTDRTAQTTCKYLFDHCLMFGIPLKLHSDGDPTFEEELFQLLMQQFGVKKLWTSGYQPQANDLTEQSNSTIKNYLRKYLNSKGSKQPDWDLWLQSTRPLDTPLPN